MECNATSISATPEEACSHKVASLEKAKNDANQLYKAKRYRQAAESYTLLIAEIVGKKLESGNLLQLADAIQRGNVRERHLVELLVALLCNAALCYFNMRSIDETAALCRACLRVDSYNYKAAYYLAQCYMAQKQYTDALKCIDRCQRIVDTKKLYSNQAKPHAALIQKINHCLSTDMSQQKEGSSCEEILASIESGIALTLNLQKLNCYTKQEIIDNKVLPKLVGILSRKTNCIENLELHSGIWSSIHQLLYRVDPKLENEMLEQLKEALEQHDLDVLKYTKNVVTTAERNFSIATSLQPILIHLSKVCSCIRTLSSLQALTLILERCNSDMDDHVLSSILRYFVNGRKGKRVLDDRSFISAVTKMLETLMSHYDLGCNSEKEENLEGCLVGIFLRECPSYEISEDTFMGMASRLLNAYLSMGTPEIEGGIFMQPTWFVTMRCLYVAARDIFKAYIISNDLMIPLLMNYISDHDGGYDKMKVKLLQSEIITLCMDFIDFREQLIRANVKQTSIIDFLKEDPGFVKYLEDIRNRDTELVKYCKTENFDFPVCISADDNKRLYEFKMLALAKFMIHSPDVTKTIIESFDMFFLVPRAVAIAIKDGSNVDILTEAMSYITLHQEAKTVGFIKFLYLQLCWAELSENCKGKTLYMICQTVVNVFRSRDDRHRFNKDTSINNMWNEGQMEALRKVYNRLPAASRPSSNGYFNEGSFERANGIRASAVLVHNDMPRCLINIANRIIKESKMEAEYSGKDDLKSVPISNAHTLVMETLHYLVSQNVNRPILQSKGVMRALIDAANSDMYKGTNQCRYLTQSIAHMCIASDPKVISYRDALDATAPLVKLLSDDSELLQYEAALGLTNLLTIDDDVRTRVWSIDGWNALGNLLYSENDQLKAACLEGWCNLTAGEDIVHGHFYKMIVQQLEAVEDHSKVLTLDIHDINIILMFVGNIEDIRSVNASTGTLALLVRDLRIANYITFFTRITNLLTTMDALDNTDVLYRIMTSISCIMQSKMNKLSAVNRMHCKSFKEKVQQCIRRNMAKFKTRTLTNMAKEVLAYKIT